MEKNEFKISTKELAYWMNTVRNMDNHTERNRVLESMWSGQLDSKAWLVNNIVDYVMEGAPVNVYVFGGWTGILANMLLQSRLLVKKIRSIDVDPWCESVADGINKLHEMNGWRFKAVTADMADFEYPRDAKPDIVINTSTEHVTQEVYDDWYDEIPNGTLVAIQGNNYFECPEHIRCAHSLDDFVYRNHATNIYYKGELETDMYTRYMCIWRK
jgi:hypothetical protein